MSKIFHPIISKDERANFKPRKMSAFYAGISALLSVIGLLGLHLGLFTGGSSVGRTIAGGAPILRGSLMGVAIEIVRGSIGMPAVGSQTGLSGYLPLVLYLAVIVLVAVVCLSLIFSIAAIVLPNLARRLCLTNGRLLLLSYGTLFLGNLSSYTLTHGSWSAEALDLPLAFTALALFTVLSLTAITESPKKGALNFALCLLSAIALGALIVPSTPLLKKLNDIVYEKPFERITLAAFSSFLLLNLFFSFIRLNAKNAFQIDILRYAVQLIGLIVLVAAYEPFTFFTDQPVNAALLLLASFDALGGAVFEALLLRQKREKKKLSVPAFSVDDEPEPIKSA